jgi:hypothetical protein
LIVGNERGMEAASEYPPRAGDLAGVWQNNLLFGNGVDYFGTADITGQQGNIRADPLLVEAPSNLRIAPWSPARNAGGERNAPVNDFDHRSRDGAVDIGAFETPQ